MSEKFRINPEQIFVEVYFLRCNHLCGCANSLDIAVDSFADSIKLFHLKLIRVICRIIFKSI